MVIDAQVRLVDVHERTQVAGYEQVMSPRAMARRKSAPLCGSCLLCGVKTGIAVDGGVDDRLPSQSDRVDS